MHMSHPVKGQGMVCVAVACRLINSVWRRQYVFEKHGGKEIGAWKGFVEKAPDSACLAFSPAYDSFKGKCPSELCIVIHQGYRRWDGNELVSGVHS